jgi:hypothetical protein
MSRRAQSYVWFGLGAVGLAGLWLTCLIAPEWSQTVGYIFLATPLLAMLISVRPGFRSDPVTSWCALGLVLLFLAARLL